MAVTEERPEETGEASHARDERLPDGGQDDTQEGTVPGHDIPFWEWVVAGLGMLLVVGMLGYLLYDAYTGPTSPPDIAVRVESVRPLPDGGGYLVRIRAENQGARTAAGVTVEGELRLEDGQTETAAATFDYVPARSRRRGGLFFTRGDPRRRGRLTLRATGYAEP